MSIPYKYEIVRVDSEARCMEVVYTSPGRETFRIGVRVPFEHESLDAVIASYAPVPLWLSKETPTQEIEVGTTGNFDPNPHNLSLFERTRLEKLAQIADWRFWHEVRGVLVDGVKVGTDRGTQAQLTSAYLSLSRGAVESVQWKGQDGVFKVIGLEEVTKMLDAVTRHVEACFATEAMLVDQVNAARSVEEIKGIELPETLYTGET